MSMKETGEVQAQLRQLAALVAALTARVAALEARAAVPPPAPRPVLSVNHAGR